MPPQQSERLLDLLDDGRDFRAHDKAPAGDVTKQAARRKPPHPQRFIIISI
jgi:hypothetical protein